MEARVAKWGNSLSLRIPKDIASRLGLAEGVCVEIETEGERIIVSRGRPRYRLSELLVGMTPKAMHRAFDWDPMPAANRSTSRLYEPVAGDLIWTDFDPRVGREQSGRGPALVVSPVSSGAPLASRSYARSRRAYAPSAPARSCRRV